MKQEKQASAGDECPVSDVLDAKKGAADGGNPDVGAFSASRMEQFARTELLLGREKLERLAAARVAVFGVGGVGGYVVEALARAGVGALDLIDNDTVSLTNLNRQILATHRTLGRCKVDVAAERVAEINPDASVRVYRTFFLPETADSFDFSQYDYVVDAIDTIAGKIELVMRAREAGVPIICAMGAGNKLNPAAFEVADLYETSVCPLARVMRTELRKRGVDRLKVVYSREKPLVPCGHTEDREEERREDASAVCALSSSDTREQSPKDGSSVSPTTSSRHTAPYRRTVPGSISFVPAAAGLILAGEVVRDLIR